MCYHKTMSKELKNKLKILNSQNKILADFGVERIGIFGSFARNEETKKSDIDILVEFNQSIDFFDFIDLEDKLSKILKRKVDLVTRKALKPAMKQQILKDVVYA